MTDVLIATLGESPAVVSTMWHKLHCEGYMAQMTHVQIIYPDPATDPFYRYIQEGYALLATHLSQVGYTVEALTLPFPDATTYDDSLAFLRLLAHLLDTHEQTGNRVFLSLAGGRKHLSALMAILVPFYSCVAGLYHLHDTRTAPRLRSVEALLRQSYII